MKTRAAFRYALLCLLVCWLSGCIIEEDDYISKYCPGSCTEIKGRIRTGIGRQAMPGVQLVATWYNLYPLTGGGIVRKKAVTKTDAQGNYTLRFLLRDDELENGYIEIHYGVDKDKYLDCRAGKTIHPGFLKRDTTYNLDFYFPKIAYLSLELTNAKDMAPTDLFFSTITYPAGSSPENTCGQALSWHGAAGKSQTVPVAAEDKIVVVNSRFKNGIQVVDSDTLNLMPGEQRSLKLTF
jgi:hypothetical protein